MSNDSTFRWPAGAATAPAAMTPAAGPDSTMYTGRSLAEAEVIMPPFDCIT